MTGVGSCRPPGGRCSEAKQSRMDLLRWSVKAGEKAGRGTLVPY